MFACATNQQTQPERRVVAYRDATLSYPASAPFDPHLSYPEYPFGRDALAPAPNAVYHAVREVLRAAGLDAARFDTPDWNPFGALVNAGGTVFIKPNWVRHFHPTGGELFSLITHPAVLRPLVDYAFKAVGPQGRIYLMDAPLYDTDFAVLAERCQLDEFERAMRARGVPLTSADLRSLIVKIDRGVVVERQQRAVWSSEGVEFDLGAESELAELSDTLTHIYGSDYNRRWTTAQHHNGHAQRHCYRIARRALEADLFISVPKLKTHKKTGVTLNIKNLIGINTDKNYIPHFRIGSPTQGGDEYPDTQSFFHQTRRFLVRHAREQVLGRWGERGEQLAHLFMTGLLAARAQQFEQRSGPRVDAVDVFYQSVQGDAFRSGDWWGNDTCWRSALDLNKILLYGRLDGRLGEQPARRYFSLIDGICGGDQTGPLAPRARHEGVLLAGFDPLSVDEVATRVMGFDPRLIRDQRRGVELTRYTLTQSAWPLRVVSNRTEWQDAIQPGADLGFEPHFAWREYLRPHTD